jgi:chromosome segregation ATPase
MVWRFLKHYGMSKASDVLDEFASAVVAFDPETASRAQIAMMQTELHKLGRRLAEAETEVQREHRETAQLRSSYERYLRAAETMERRLAEFDERSRHAELEASLARVIERLEQLKPEIAREEREDQEVEAWAAELRRAFETLGAKLRRAESDLRAARRDMEMAHLQRQRVAEHEGRATGVTSALASLSVALDAMNRESARVRTETEALKLQASLFQSDRLDTDPNIAAALAESTRALPGSHGSLSERLAALRRPEMKTIEAA